MLVLGIDPGLGNTGYGIIKIQNNDFSLVDFGVFKTKNNEFHIATIIGKTIISLKNLEKQGYFNEIELNKNTFQGKNLNLKAPQKDQGGRDYWSYSLLKEMKVNDYVVHYHKKEKSIVAVSQVAKPWISKPTKWTPSKKKQFKNWVS